MFISKLRESRLLGDTRGLTTVEYVIVLSLIAAVSVGAWQKFGSKVYSYVNTSQKKIDGEMKKGAGE